MEQEEIYQELRRVHIEWLEYRGLSEDDVMENEAGKYVYLDDEDGLNQKYLPSVIDLTF